MVPPEACRLNFVSPQCVRRGEGGRKKSSGSKLFLLFNRLRKPMAIREINDSGEERSSCCKSERFLMLGLDEHRENI